MEITFNHAIPVLPAAEVEVSLRWWTTICGFTETFRSGEPPVYAGLRRGPVLLHLAQMSDASLARTIGDQTMLRFSIDGLDAFYAEYRQRGGIVHPNGPLRQQPWGGRAFDTIDPCGVCVTFTEA